MYYNQYFNKYFKKYFKIHLEIYSRVYSQIHDKASQIYRQINFFVFKLLFLQICLVGCATQTNAKFKSLDLPDTWNEENAKTNECKKSETLISDGQNIENIQNVQNVQNVKNDKIHNIKIIDSNIVINKNSNDNDNNINNDNKCINCWWNNFKDDKLSNLINISLKSNPDILIAMTRVTQAQALLGIADSNKLPSVDIQGSFNKGISSTSQMMSPSPLSSQSIQSTNAISIVGGILSYQLDIWQKVANTSKAAKANLLALESTKKAVELTITGNITNTYFKIIELKEQLALLSDLLATQQEICNIKSYQFDFGKINQYELSQARSELASLVASKEILKQNLINQKYVMLILIGASPKSMVNVDSILDMDTTLNAFSQALILPKFMPSSLLKQRPDIVAANHQIAASNANVAVAAASYFPDISLTALIGAAGGNFSSSSFSTLFDNVSTNWQIGANLAQPLLNFGKIASKIKFAKAREQESVEQYISIVKTAFSEVLQAMSAQQTSEIALIANQERQMQLQIAFDISDQRYTTGYSDYLSLLSDKKALLQSKIDTISSYNNRLAASVGVFTALGGNWE